MWSEYEPKRITGTPEIKVKKCPMPKPKGAQNELRTPEQAIKLSKSSHSRRVPSEHYIAPRFINHDS